MLIIFIYFILLQNLLLVFLVDNLNTALSVRKLTKTKHVMPFGMAALS